MGNRGLSRTIGIGNRSKEFQSIVPFPSNEAQQEEKIENARKRKVEEAGRIDDDQVKDVKFSGLGSVPVKVDFNESEGKIRRNNLAFYESECSQVSKFIFVSGMKVAADYDLLIEKGIKRIINCAPMVVPNFHEATGAFEYLSINLVDGRVEDISWFICQVIHFIKDSVLRGEKVLIHCEKGVSRSCSIAIAHRMWQTGESWKISFDFIKTQRRICSPNTAFTVNLIELTELFNGDASRATLLYRLAYHAPYDPDTPVLKLCRNDMNRRILVPATSLLNPKAVFVLRAVKPVPSNQDGNSISSNTNNNNSGNSLRSQASQSHLHDLYVWMGSESTVLAQEAGVQQAKLMLDVFSQAKELRIVKEGEEPTEFFSCMASDGPFQRNSNNGVTTFNDYFGACQPTEAEMQDAATMRFAASSITQEFLRTFAANAQNNNNQASLSSLGADTAPITSATVSRNNSNAKLNYPLPISAVGGNANNTFGDDNGNQPMSGIGVSRSRSNTVSSLNNNNTADMVVSIPAALSRANSFSSVDSDGQSILSREERINRIHNIIDVAVNGSNSNNGGVTGNTSLSLNLSLGVVSGTNQYSGIGSGSGSGNNRSRHRAKRRSRGSDDHNQGNHHGGSQSSANANATNSENEQDNSSLDSTGDSPVSFNKRKMDTDTGLERPSDSESSSCGPRVSDSVPSIETNPEQSLLFDNTSSGNSAVVDANNNEFSGSGMTRTSSKPRFVPSIGLYPLAEVRDSASNSAMNTSRPTSAAPSSGSARVVGAGSTKSLSLSLGDVVVGNNSNNFSSNASQGQGLAPSSSRGKLSLGLNLTPAVVNTGAEESPSQQQRLSPSGILPLSLPTAVNNLHIRSNDKLPGLSLSTASLNQNSASLQNSDSTTNNATVVPKKTPSKPLLFQVSACENHQGEGKMGQWTAMGVYDDEDLDEQNALLLLCPSRTHYLWIGADSHIQDAFVSAMEESENTGDSTHLRQWAQRHIANGELDAWDVDWENDTFILENPGNESESFWEKFNEGS